MFVVRAVLFIDDVEGFMQNSDTHLFVIDAKDRFGDLGTIGLYLVRSNSEDAIIDSFILSCRALGRELESAVMNCIKQDFLLDRSYTTVRATFIPTKKNMPAKEFFEKQGFRVVEDTERQKQYVLNEADVNLVECGWIEVRREK